MGAEFRSQFFQLSWARYGSTALCLAAIAGICVGGAARAISIVVIFSTGVLLDELIGDEHEPAHRIRSRADPADSCFAAGAWLHSCAMRLGWRGGRAVECTALEMRHTGNRIGGSNPSLSATRTAKWLK
jgi:hypothetical protein